LFRLFVNCRFYKIISCFLLLKPCKIRLWNCSCDSSIDTAYQSVKHILEEARKKAYSAVKFAMVQAYWNIGRIIFEEEQKGKATAGYGEYLISELAARLTAEFGKGFIQINLRYMRLFYLSFEIMNASASQSPPEQIHHALRDELKQCRHVS
jgi:DUF1016 N-terminal domain